MTEQFDTAMSLLAEAAAALDEPPESQDGSETDVGEVGPILSDRIRAYLATCRPTTPVGMPRLTSPDNRLSTESVLARAQNPHNHVRIVP